MSDSAEQTPAASKKQDPGQESTGSDATESKSPLSSISLTGLSDIKPKTDDPKKSHHSGILQLFGAKPKLQPPNSLENLYIKVASKSKNDSTPTASTPSSSVGFLQRLPFHHLHSNKAASSHSVQTDSSTPDSSAATSFQQPNVPTSAAFSTSPVHPLYPLPELDTPKVESQPNLGEISEDTQTSTRKDSHAQDDSWYESISNEPELRNLEKETGLDQLPILTAISERDAIQKALDELLTEFRSGQMRALSDQQLEQMRDMHKEQLKLSAMHMVIYKEDMELYGDMSRKSHNLGQADFGCDELDEKYATISQHLDNLHNMMDKFHS